MKSGTRQNGLLALGLFISGFASLGYQVVWSKRLAVVFGLELPALLAVITAFMGGYALGAFLLETPIRKSRNARGWLVLFEIVIAIWGLVSVMLLKRLPQFSLMDTFLSQGRFTAFFAIFAFSLVAFLPATLAMGCTLPAMESVWRAQTQTKRCIGGVYGLNTAGAVAGVLFVTFWGIRIFGLNQCLVVLASLNTASGLLFWTLPKSASIPLLDPSAPHTTPPRFGMTKLIVIGFLGMGLQVMILRLLSQTLANTTYTYAAVVGAYLIAVSLGAFLFQRHSHHPKRDRYAVLASVITGFAILGTLFLLPIIHQVYPAMANSLKATPAFLIPMELGSAMIVLLLPLLGSGYLFAFLLQQVGSARGAFGSPLGYNLLGATAAPLVLYACLPLLSSRTWVIGLAIGYCVIAGPAIWRQKWFLGPAFLLVFLMAPNPQTVLGIQINPSDKIDIVEGRFGVVSVVEEADGNKRLDFNNRFLMGGSRATRAEQRQAHIPLLLHPEPTQALFLGVGTGITLGASVDYPNLQVDAVELVPEIVSALPEFSRWNGFPFPAPRVTLHAMDARRFIRQSVKQYDVIVGDVFHPSRDGAGLLYTREHFQAVQERLARGGLFCQWLPLHQLSENGLQTIHYTLQSVFPHVGLWLLDTNIDLPVVGLIATSEPFTWDRARYERATSPTKLYQALKEGRLHSPIRLISNLLVSNLAAMSLPQNLTLNTDDHQIISYRSPLEPLPDKPFSLLEPYITFSEASLAGLDHQGRSISWLHSWKSELASRDLYLRGQLAGAEGRAEEAVNRFLEGVSLGKEFTLNYSQLIAYATELSAKEPKRAAELLRQLINRRPEVTLAQRLLDRLQGTSAPNN